MIATTPHTPEIVIRCANVTKQYRHARVLHAVDLSVRHGETLGLIGPGGAGKSLLVKIVCGLLRPDSGHVEVNGQTLSNLDEPALQALRSGIGMVFQNYALFDSMSVADNLALPLRMASIDEEEIRARVHDMLERVALPDAHAKMPRELSGGMKKRVSFARAVIRRPPIVIYDDPTAGLDPVTSAKIFRLLQDMKDQGTTSIVVSHDLDGLRPLCDTWAVMHRGQLCFHGNTHTITRCTTPIVHDLWHA